MGYFLVTAEMFSLSLQGISDRVQKTGEGKKCALVCSCGECVGEFITYRKGLKYCLDLQKVRRYCVCITGIITRLCTSDKFFYVS